MIVNENCGLKENTTVQSLPLSALLLNHDLVAPFLAGVVGVVFLHCHELHLEVCKVFFRLHVLSVAQMLELLVELAVATLEHIGFWVEQLRVAAQVDAAVDFAKLGPHLGASLLAEFAVEN